MSGENERVYLAYLREVHVGRCYCLSCVVLPESAWNSAERSFAWARSWLWQAYGVPEERAISARALVAGRGGFRGYAPGARARMLRSQLEVVRGVPGVRLFNVVLTGGDEGAMAKKGWDRVLNRLQRALREEERATAIVFADRGRAQAMGDVLREMRWNNWIPSAFGSWREGRVREVPTTRIIENLKWEDPAHFLLQLADCVAVALWQREVAGALGGMFDDSLADVCWRRATRYDRLGIVRR